MESPLPSPLALPVDVKSRADQVAVQWTDARPVARERKRRAREAGLGAVVGKSGRDCLGGRAL